MLADALTIEVAGDGWGASPPAPAAPTEAEPPDGGVPPDEGEAEPGPDGCGPGFDLCLRNPPMMACSRCQTAVSTVPRTPNTLNTSDSKPLHKRSQRGAADWPAGEDMAGALSLTTSSTSA